MSDSWKERAKAQEEAYFAKQNAAALNNLKRQANEVRKSPVDGKPMVQKVVHGVTIDLCESSGGVWLDAGELEQLMKVATGETKSDGGFLASVINSLVKKG